ncbi:MAG TPA: methyltransferase [Burkholderiales bacterium]|jgi:predicted methyltransferase|nr:methyltransferase [Burkholderiales bacterium]
MKQALQSIFCALLLPLLAAGAMVAPARAQDTEALIDRTMTGSHRSDANKARDKYRHPKETLLFFGLKPNMTVVEITPGAGWYTEILAPVMRGGTYYAAIFQVTAQSSEIQRTNDGNFRAKLAGDADLYGKVQLSVFAPNAIKVAPTGSADMVLTFRNVHNWAKAGTVDAMFRAFHDALKPGGVLGVVEHRAKPGTAFQRQIDSGYMTEAYVIETAQKAGFKLDNKSEINANPKDTADYPGGVWTLPPTLRNVSDADKPKYLAIGESDRMALKFVKP